MHHCSNEPVPGYRYRVYAQVWGDHMLEEDHLTGDVITNDQPMVTGFTLWRCPVTIRDQLRQITWFFPNPIGEHCGGQNAQSHQ